MTEKRIVPFEEKLFSLLRKEFGIAEAIAKLPDVLKFLGK